jgi:DNA polymerase III sliding clamp (beta) subunit (PCNA family)
MDALDFWRLGGRLNADATLIEFRAGKHCLISKLIDDAFPDYHRVIPKPSGNHFQTNRETLVAAAARAIAAGTDVGLGFIWEAGAPVVNLCLSRQQGVVADELDAETFGRGRVAVSAELLAEQLERIGGDVVRIDSEMPSMPVLVTRPDDERLATVLMPLVWMSATAEEAA